VMLDSVRSSSVRSGGMESGVAGSIGRHEVGRVARDQSVRRVRFS
jgi:hypothetical protein